MNNNRRRFLINSSLTLSGLAVAKTAGAYFPFQTLQEYEVPESLRKEMYEKALSIAKTKVRGGGNDPYYRKPFVDAAFSSNIFYWDTCFIACYAKYHTDELPILNALDNFYELMEPDGFICREYTRERKAMWPKEHPVSMNPPLLAFAELQLYAVTKNKTRLAAVYPKLKKHFEYWVQTCRGDDKLFFNDALGSGMDNIDRYPYGWQDDGKGIPMRNLFPEIFAYKGLNPAWNRQGRMVDVSAQICLFAANMEEIAGILTRKDDIPAYKNLYAETKNAINTLCWNEEDAFYYDLGYGKQIKRKHIGMFWCLIAGVVPNEKLSRFLKHLTNPNEFWRSIPVATMPADQQEFSPKDDYWRGSVWVPTNYMILLGLLKYGEKKIANKLARQYYWAVAEVYKKTGTFWENYAPDFIDRGNDSRPDFCGWTGIVPITIYREFIT
ncbi:MAG: hypothetical protein JNK91_04130 [Ferruginibacter sp.]|nr:hypothetical protein [Ferruginibacter sp.]